LQIQIMSIETWAVIYTMGALLILFVEICCESDRDRDEDLILKLLKGNGTTRKGDGFEIRRRRLGLFMTRRAIM